MMEPRKLEKIKSAIRELDEAEYESLSAPQRRKVRELVAADRAIAEFRTYETKVMTPDISTAVKEKARE